MTTATTNTPVKQMRKYQVLAGIHIDTHPTRKDEEGKPVDRITRRGEIVETTQDLDKLNVTGFAPKFRRIHGDEPREYQPPPKPKVVDLSSMDEVKLAQFAVDNEIDIKGLKSKDEKLKAIRSALAE